MYRSSGEEKDATWLNVFVAAYPLAAILIVTFSMLQPFAWYFKGGPITGAREVQTILTAILSTVSGVTWIFLLAPLIIALIAILTRSVLHTSTLWVTALFVILLPLTFFGTENIFAPLAHLRVEYRATEEGKAGKVWMLSKGGTALLVEHSGDGKRISLRNISRSMVESVADIVQGSSPGTTWSCQEHESGIISMKSGGRKVSLEGCPTEGGKEIVGVSERDTFSVQTLLLLMDAGIE